MQSRSPNDEFRQPDLPVSLEKAVWRFLKILCISALVFYFLYPAHTGDWLTGMIFGSACGLLWNVSWLWKGQENRVLAWLATLLGTYLVWGIFHQTPLPTIGGFLAMYAAHECIGLMFYPAIRKRWGADTA